MSGAPSTRVSLPLPCRHTEASVFNHTGRLALRCLSCRSMYYLKRCRYRELPAEAP